MGCLLVGRMAWQGSAPLAGATGRWRCTRAAQLIRPFTTRPVYTAARASDSMDPRISQSILIQGDQPDDASDVEYVTCVKSLDDVWTGATVASKLPPGTYALIPQGLDPSSSAQEWESKVALSWMLGSYSYDRYKTATEKKRGVTEPRVLVVKPSAETCHVRQIAEAICFARDLINTPAQDLNPSQLAASIQSAMGDLPGVELTVFSGSKLLEPGASFFPAVHAVGRASDCPPCVIDVRWAPDAGAALPEVVLVGKGVTFDSGGLQVKPGAAMKLMRKDMGGAAIMVALARLIIGVRLPVRLRLLIPAAENAIGPGAFRPGDVLQTRGGTTIEVGHTDAEGRLLLADALCAACERRPPPDLVLDAATLTGAARVALGAAIPAFFCDDDRISAKLSEAAKISGDPLWRLPLHAPYASALDSKLADVLSAAEGGLGGAITAALFLQKFVMQGTPWVHVDCMAWNPKSEPGRPEGGEATGLLALWTFLLDRYTPEA